MRSILFDSGILSKFNERLTAMEKTVIIKEFFLEKLITILKRCLLGCVEK